MGNLDFATGGRVEGDQVVSSVLRAARALAGLKASELAAMAKVDASTVSRLEGRGHKTVGGQATTIDALRRALLHRGVEIVDDGVRFIRKRTMKKLRMPPGCVLVPPEQGVVFTLIGLSRSGEKSFVDELRKSITSTRPGNDFTEEKARDQDCTTETGCEQLNEKTNFKRRDQPD